MTVKISSIRPQVMVGIVILGGAMGLLTWQGQYDAVQALGTGLLVLMTRLVESDEKATEPREDPE